MLPNLKKISGLKVTVHCQPCKKIQVYTCFFNTSNFSDNKEKMFLTFIFSCLF